MFHDLIGVLHSLRSIGQDRPSLPILDVQFSRLTPDQAWLAVHDHPYHFEQWREHLGIDPAKLEFYWRNRRARTFIVEGRARVQQISLILTLYGQIETKESNVRHA